MAFASKTPLPILFLLAGCVIFAKQLFFEVSHPGDEGTQRRNPVIELATLGVLLFAMGIVLMGANEMKIEIRYLLPLFPFLYILVAGFLAGLRGRQAVRVPTLGLGWLLVGVGWVHPSYLSHFNLAAGGESGGHRILLDSNLDWGQDLYRLIPLVPVARLGSIWLLDTRFKTPESTGR